MQYLCFLPPQTCVIYASSISFTGFSNPPFVFSFVSTHTGIKVGCSSPSIESNTHRQTLLLAPEEVVLEQELSLVGRARLVSRPSVRPSHALSTYLDMSYNNMYVGRSTMSMIRLTKKIFMARSGGKKKEKKIGEGEQFTGDS